MIETLNTTKEKEVTDSYKEAYIEWTDKTDWIQERRDRGTLPSRYLGWHRVDIMKDMIEQLENQDGVNENTCCLRGEVV